MATTGKLPPAEEAARTAVLEPVPKPKPKRRLKESARPEIPFRAGKMKEPPMPDEGAPMAKGGSASSRADGIAQRGKTKGKVC